MRMTKLTGVMIILTLVPFTMSIYFHLSLMNWV